MKKFYTLVSTQKQGESYAIELDGRAIKTPLKNTLIAPNEDIANAIATEWSGQGDEIIPDTMPLTQILSTKIDKVEKERDAMQTPLLKYLDTDLLCYRTDNPEALKAAQEEAWDQYLDWFEEKFGTTLKTTAGLSALTQPQAAHNAIKDHVENLSSDHFTILQLVAPICGSLVLGLAFIEGRINAEEVFKVIRVEENFKAEIYNEEFYGADPAQEPKDKDIQRDLKAAETYLSLIF